MNRWYQHRYNNQYRLGKRPGSCGHTHHQQFYCMDTGTQRRDNSPADFLRPALPPQGTHLQNGKGPVEKITTEQPLLSPLHVWRAYEQLGQAGGSAKNELTALVSLIRTITGIDGALTGYDKTVDKNFQDWVFKKQAGAATKFTEEQMQWLRMIKDHVAGSFHVDKEDFELDPFNKNGGLGKMWQLFGDKTDEIINELNEVLAA